MIILHVNLWPSSVHKTYELRNLGFRKGANTCPHSACANYGMLLLLLNNCSAIVIVTEIMFCSLDQMVVHARSGGTIEVMGLMQGKTDGDTIIIMDAFALPVEGTETRVNAQADAYEYMVQYSQTNKQVPFLSPPTMSVIVI